MSEADCYPFQQTLIRGVVTDSAGNPVSKAGISVTSLNTGTYTNEDGTYSLPVPKDGNEIILSFSCIGFKNETRSVRCDRNEIIINIILSEEVRKIDEVIVSADQRGTDISLTRIPVKELKILPSPSGSFEAIIKTMPGVASNNELSSQYSVRGGNYDENLVYVNDVEIFRPFLIRSGQQEGLSFINPDLVSSVSFSSGGFGASYGDKMSSVLDIRYRKPVTKKGSVSLGLLSSSAHLEGISNNGKLTWLAGARFKSSKLMLKTLDSEGDYQPVFFDLQSVLNYRTGINSTLSLLTTYSSNIYNFIPRSRSSTFGSEAIAYQLYVLFNGSEKDSYNTLNTVLTWEFRDRNSATHKILASAFVTGEYESFDIRGSYNMSILDKNSGSENFSDTLMNIGLGSFLSHARNRLGSVIIALGYKGDKELGKTRIKWGARLRHDDINDRLKEWTRVDSSGYSLPANSDDLEMARLISVSNYISNLLGETYAELSRSFSTGNKEYLISGGFRGTFDSFTSEALISPRISARLKTGEKLAFSIAGGLYYQPPFYREMRYPDGSINREIRSQNSIHLVAGITYDFSLWDRPFRLSSEIYSKFLNNIIPYKVDNVRLIYSGENSAEGYTMGADLRLNGEFVPGAESWISFSLMNSKLRIPGELDEYFPAPFDQTFSTNIFFQDYLPGNPTWRAHINIHYATGLPIVSPYNNRYDQYHRLPDYRRVDLGITKIIKGKNHIPGNLEFLKYIDELIAGMEVYNLLDINNTVSYYWVKTINNISGRTRQFAVPEYLTGRCLNFKVMATF
jgi:hypothetical protein